MNDSYFFRRKPRENPYVFLTERFRYNHQTEEICDFTLVWRGSLPDWTPDATQNLIAKGIGVLGGVQLCVITDGYIKLVLYGIPSLFQASAVNSFIDGTIHEIAFSSINKVGAVDGAAVLYVDGVVPAQTFDVTADKTTWMSDASLLDNARIGDSNSNGGGEGRWFDGSISDVRIYNRALSAEEVKQLYLGY